MKFTPYWVKETREIKRPDGQSYRVSAWGWSDSNESDAGMLAAKRAQRAVEAFARGDTPASRYSYEDRPLREAVLEKFTHDGVLGAAISRNAYGARILNTASMMFVDVDIEESVNGSLFPGFIRTFFGLRAPASREDQIQSALQLVRSWVQEDPERSVRVYKTHSGLRYLVTHTVMDPTSKESDALLSALQADPRYRALCKTQACYRARLTPKPWRIGMSTPPVEYPFFSERDRTRIDTWISEYQERSNEVAVCTLLDVLGSDSVYPEFEEYIAIHDRETKLETNLPLA